MEALFHVASSARPTRKPPRMHDPSMRDPHDARGPHDAGEPQPSRDAQCLREPHLPPGAPLAFEYRAGLTTCELIAEVLRLLDIERGAERLVCRYLADLADRIQRRRGLALLPVADELRAARCSFGLGPREARERVRVGRALRQLPEIERALVDGALSYSRVREITRVATAATELEWLELACQLDMRSLERRVARTMTGAEDAPAPEATGSSTRRVTFELSEQAWSLLERALDTVRAGRASCSDGEALEVVARVALSAQGSLIGQHETAGACGAPNVSTGPITTIPTTVTTAVGATGAAPTVKPVRPWSWDDLGWGATQSGSSSARHCPRAAGGSREDDAAERAHQNTADGGRHDDDSAWGATQSGSSSARHCPRAAGGSREEGAQGSREEGVEGSREDDANGSGEEAGELVDLEDTWWDTGPEESEEESRSALERERWGEINSRLLLVMGGAGRWSADSLIEASGLSAREVNTALTYLQLGRRIRRRGDAFEPV